MLYLQQLPALAECPHDWGDGCQASPVSRPLGWEGGNGGAWAQPRSPFTQGLSLHDTPLTSEHSPVVIEDSQAGTKKQTEKR